MVPCSLCQPLASSPGGIVPLIPPGTAKAGGAKGTPMGCKIVVTRDDTGAELSNEMLATMLRGLDGVKSVRLEGVDAEGLTFRKSWIVQPAPFEGVPTVVAINGEEWVDARDMVRWHPELVVHPDCPRGKAYLVPAEVGEEILAHGGERLGVGSDIEEAVAASVRQASEDFNRLLYGDGTSKATDRLGPLLASNRPADVDAYVARQAERMGHTEDHRGECGFRWQFSDGTISTCPNQRPCPDHSEDAYWASLEAARG